MSDETPPPDPSTYMPGFAAAAPPPDPSTYMPGFAALELQPSRAVAPDVVTDFTPTEDQQVALDAVQEWLDDSDESFFALTGPAGSGKTTLLRKLVRANMTYSYRTVERRRGDTYEEETPDIGIAALTGKAALRVGALTGQAARTLHAALYWPPEPGEDLRFVKLRNPSVCLMVVDESSMVTPSLYEHMGVWAKQGVKFLLVGDTFQLPPVITNKEELLTFGEDYSVFSRVQGANLETVMRNAGGVLRAATQVRLTGKLPRVSDFDEDGVSGYHFISETAPISRAVREYVEDRNDHLLVTWRNEARMDANERIRALLGHGGELPDSGEPVLIRKNGQGVLNGEVLECLDYEMGPFIDNVRTLWMRVKVLGGEARLLVTFDGGDPEKGGRFFDGGQPRIGDWRKYHATLRTQLLPEPLPVTWGYCLTAHTAQGSQARRTTVFLERRDLHNQNFTKATTLPDGSKATMAARWVYTAITRSQKLTTMILGK